MTTSVVSVNKENGQKTYTLSLPTAHDAERTIANELTHWNSTSKAPYMARVKVAETIEADTEKQEFAEFAADQYKPAKQWAADLTSGKYTQGNGKLRDLWGQENAKLCCLGVIVEREVAGERAEWTSAFGLSTSGLVGIANSSSNAPDGFFAVVNEDLGFTQQDFIRMNDSRRYTFDQIADEILKRVDQKIVEKWEAEKERRAFIRMIAYDLDAFIKGQQEKTPAKWLWDSDVRAND